MKSGSREMESNTELMLQVEHMPEFNTIIIINLFALLFAINWKQMYDVNISVAGFNLGNWTTFYQAFRTSWKASWVSKQSDNKGTVHTSFWSHDVPVWCSIWDTERQERGTGNPITEAGQQHSQLELKKKLKEQQKRQVGTSWDFTIACASDKFSV